MSAAETRPPRCTAVVIFARDIAALGWGAVLFIQFSRLLVSDSADTFRYSVLPVQ